jgi:phosphoserine phosphatase
MSFYCWTGDDYAPAASPDDFPKPAWSLRFWPSGLESCLLSRLKQLAPLPLDIQLSDAMVEIRLPELELERLKQWVAQLVDAPFNYAVQPMATRIHRPELMVFDMDSTLIQMECIDELARRCGFYQQVAAITESAMRGELDFAQSLRKRVALLKGLPTSVIDQLACELPLTEGVETMANWARQQGIKLAIVSGGFVPFAESLQRKLQFDYAFANQLGQHNGHLTGEVIGPIVDGERKKSLLIDLRQQLKLSPESVWAIGDGANDLPMIHEAGLGIAFDAKPRVKAQAWSAIHSANFLPLLQLLQHSYREIGEI